MNSDLIYLVQTDTTVGFSSSSDEKLSLLKQRPLTKKILNTVDSFSTLNKNEGEIALAGVIEEQVADVSSVYSEFFDILEIEKREENWCRISGKRKTTI